MLRLYIRRWRPWLKHTKLNLLVLLRKLNTEREQWLIPGSSQSVWYSLEKLKRLINVCFLKDRNLWKSSINLNCTIITVCNTTSREVHVQSIFFDDQRALANIWRKQLNQCQECGFCFSDCRYVAHGIAAADRFPGSTGIRFSEMETSASTSTTVPDWVWGKHPHWD